MAKGPPLLVVPALLLAAAPVAGQSNVPEGFDDVQVAAGLEKPTSMAFAPDGRLFVTEQEGTVRVVVDGSPASTPFLAVPTDSSNERGLLGLAFDPGFPREPYVYLYYTRQGLAANRLSRFTVSRAHSDVADPASEHVLLDDVPSAHFHNGGALHFAPDGTLLVAVGDAEEPESAQSLSALTGKLLRVDRTGRPPADNPFSGNPAARPEVWAYGLRNPFTFAVQPGSGRVLVNDVGRAAFEEINEGSPGANYGWPACEGPCGGGVGDPSFSYPHGKSACAITGAVFARGLRFPAELLESYFFSDYCGRWIMRLDADGDATEFARDMSGEAVDLDVGPDGALYYLSYVNGEVRRIEFVGAGNRRPVAVAAASPASGTAPLQVVLSAEASRDPDGDALAFAWDFGDGSPAGTGPIVTHAYRSNGAYRARVTAADPHGGQATSAVSVTVGTPPVAAILEPAVGAGFRPGEVVRYSGSAADPDGGPVPADALVWTVVLHHHPEVDPRHHTHPYQGPVVGGAGAFEVATTLHDDDVFFRIHLAATDADGLTQGVTRDVVPARP